MKTVMTVMTVLALAAGTGVAADASVSLDAASAYVFRGATLNDGFVLQPGLEVASGDLTLGVWGNYDINDFGGALAEYEFSEIDLYGSYTLPIDLLDVSLGYTEYTYPNGGEADREVGLGLGKDMPGAPSLGVYYGFDGAIENSLYVELGLGHEVALGEDGSVSFGATVGYVAPDEGDAGFSHYTATLGASYAFVSASLTYIGEIDDDILGDAYDVELVGMLGVSADL